MPSVSLRSRRSVSSYDASSGLTWNETTIPSSHNPSLFRTSSKRRNPSVLASRRTVPSLQELAIQSLLDNIDQVDVHTLQGLPFTLATKLWKRVEQQNLTTPTVWAAFCAAFPEDEQFHYYTASDMAPQRSMQELISGLSSPKRGLDSYYWLTALTISNLELTQSDVLDLTRLPNLVALDIHSPTTDPIGNVSDRTIRAWSEHSATSGAFSKLQVLILRHQRQISHASLNYLNHFPNLTLFGVKGCDLSQRHEAEANALGWTTNDEHGIIDSVRRDMTMAQTTHGMLYGIIRRSKCLLDAQRADGAALSACTSRTTVSDTTNDTASESLDPPLLSYRIGRVDSKTICNTTDETSPLIFFRSTRYDPNQVAPPPSTRASRDIWPYEAAPPATVKRRKLRHTARKDVSEELGLGLEGMRTTANSH